MSFIAYDLIFLVVFTLAVVFFLYRKRANLKRQGIMYLYRTRVGIKLIDTVSTRYAKILRPMQYLVLACGYILMVSMVWFLIKFTWIYSQSSVFIRAAKIPPLVPLVPYLPELFKVDYLPPFYFTYWIVIIAVIAISHEFAHGIFARLNKIKVHSTGFGFLGPFLAAFVEPDEKDMAKASKFAQLSVLAAGTFANIVMTVLFGLIFWLFFVTSFSAAGVQFNTYGTAIVNFSAISMVGGHAVNEVNFSALSGEAVKIEVDNRSYFAPTSGLKTAYEKQSYIVVFEDAPAYRSGLSGPIVAVNDVPVSSLDSLKQELQKYKSGEHIYISTLNDEGINRTEVVLADRAGQPYLGIGVIKPARRGIMGYFYAFLEHIKDPSVYYAPIWGGEFAWFVYNLLWWVVIINFSVALVNMLPVGIFDGGRFFYLTVWGLTGKEKWGRKAFSISTWIVLAIAVWLMVRWAFAYI